MESDKEITDAPVAPDEINQKSRRVENGKFGIQRDNSSIVFII